MGITVSCRHRHNIRKDFFCAIREGDPQQVRAILDKKAELINGSPLHKRTLLPLHCAALHGQPDVLLLLLEKGTTVNVMNDHRQTPLMFACKNGRTVCVEQLLAWGADILVFDSPNGRTCLHYAAKSGHIHCVQRVLDAAQTCTVAQTWGFSRFVNVRDGSGATPLHLAARHSHPAVVRLLLNNGAIVCATTTRSGGSGCGFGCAPLHFAARGGSTECVKELLAWGADRTQRNSQGQTPFFIAVRYNNAACAALLNPLSAEPLVWPSSWKFMSNLDPEAKILLEAALVKANDAWEKRIISSNHLGDAYGEQQSIVNETENKDDEETEMCCICFEHECIIEVHDCGHQMCADCTLALCCHSKPNPVMRHSSAPVCPFCRRTIMQLKCVQPKESELEQTVEEGDSDKNMGKTNVVNVSKKLVEGTSSAFMGLVGKGSFRVLTSRGSGRVSDADALKECSSGQGISAV